MREGEGGASGGGGEARGGERSGSGPPLLPTRCGELISVSLSPWFDVADLSMLEAHELDALAALVSLSLSHPRPYPLPPKP